MNYRSKIIVGIGCVLIVCAGLFVFVYPMLSHSNDALALQLDERKKEFENLNSEKKSIEQGQRDLNSMEGKPLQPKDFFSSDKTLVSEVKMIESIAADYNVELQLRVSGTTTAALTVPKTTSGLISVAYTMDVPGSFNNFVRFLDALEHLPFVTQVRTIQITAVTEDGKTQNIRAQLGAEFYLKR